ncbi:MAG: RNA ligase RtcB family protein [Candidatus Obscuribacter sp.]|nr:RNA ligase RtcB family protein [Candidatus Obscuribacter sp.]
MDVKIFASDANWIEGKSIEQLNQTALLPGMIKAVGMPDLHPGKGTPIGAAFATGGVIYPHLIGNDIGCGMALWRTGLHKTKLKLDQWTKRLNNLEDASPDGHNAELERYELTPTRFDKSLGTVGGGNHFAELQVVQTIVDSAAFESMALSRHALYILVHSGSRGLGEHILKGHQSHHGNGALKDNSVEATRYLSQHNTAVTWAKLNRKLIAQNFMRILGTDGTMLLDVCHNCVERSKSDETAMATCWIHRKGAAPSDQGPIVIPGSRGTLSYLVMPTGDQVQNLFTLAHGAGRKWQRSDCRARLADKYTRESLEHTALGGRVICKDKDLLYEEAPQAYKNIDIVVSDLVDAGLVKIVATLAPQITYKTGGR